MNLADGVVVGALSLVKNDCQSFGVYAGVPAVHVGERKRDLLSMEKDFLSDSKMQ